MSHHPLPARTRYLTAAPLVVALGLLSRTPGAAWGVPAATGDALYAVLVYVLIRAARPTAARERSAAVSWAICAAIETSQAWHTPWLDAARTRAVWALLLGRGFLWSDLVAYTVGVAVAWRVDRALSGFPLGHPRPVPRRGE